MSEPPASSDFTSRNSNSNSNSRSNHSNHNSSTRRISSGATNSSSSHRRADPPSDPPDSRRQLSSSQPNVSRNTKSSRGVATPTARASSSNVLPSSPSVKRPTIEPPPKGVSPQTPSKKRDAPPTINASVSSALPTFKGQVSGGSILRIEGKKVATSATVHSEQVKKAMEDARRQQVRDNNEPPPSESIVTNKISNLTGAKHGSIKNPIVEQSPQPKNSTKYLSSKNNVYDIDEAKSVTLMEPPSPATNEVKPNPKAELAPKIPSQYEKKKKSVHTPPTALLATTSSPRKLEETWEFDTAPTNASTGSCCIIS